MSSLFALAATGIYLCLLFGIAFYIDRRSRQSPNDNTRLSAWIYALSIAVYCTSWTFYGSVGHAAVNGISFLSVYIGPILVFVFGQHLLRKMQLLCASEHITSIADFISARYGKNQGLAGLVTIIAVLGIMPYISLQLKAVSASLELLNNYPAVLPSLHEKTAIWNDTTLFLTLLMALFVIIFGTRHVDATEQHRGMVTAIAVESIIKLTAFLVVGFFVTYGMFDGFSDLFTRAASQNSLAPLLEFGQQASSTSFWMVTALSAIAIFCLPRQFQVTFVESNTASHLKTARWAFPLYLIAINLFVLPIALAGLITFSDLNVSPDTFVLTLPIAADNHALAILAFIGGLSAATGMIIVETIALSTMICNDLVMPVLIRGELIKVDTHSNIGRLVKNIRRIAIIFVLLLGYTYVRLVGDSYALVSIGLVSFCAAAQFAPAIIGGLFWRGGTRTGALAGLSFGFAIWAYTLLLPSFARSGWLPAEFANDGIFFIEALRPYALFGISGLDPVTHSFLWSMIFNIGAYIFFSNRSNPSVLEKSQALIFVDAFNESATPSTRIWSADIRVGQIIAMLGHFIDHDRANRAYAEYATANRLSIDPTQRADHNFIKFAENLLAGAIGAALARVIIASTIREKEVGLDGVMEMLTGASQAIETTWERTREAIENIPQGITVFDAEQRLVAWNQRFFDLLDFPDSLAVVGTRFSEFFRHNAKRGEYGPGDIEQQVAERVAKANNLEPHLFERKRPDGTVIEIRGKPLPGGGFITTYTDITARKHAEMRLKESHGELEKRVAERTRDLQESEARFRDLAESGSDWIWQTDAELKFTYISERFFEVSGNDPKLTLGRKRNDMLNFSGDEQLRLKWQSHLADIEARRAFRRFEYPLNCADGRVLHVRVAGKPFFDDNGTFLGYRGTGSDITELMMAQDELLHAEKLAALGGLVAGVAHEINTPVGIGLTAASYLEEKTRKFESIYQEGKVKRSDIEAFIKTSLEASASLTTNLKRAADLVRSFKQVAVDQSSEIRRSFLLKPYIEEILVSLHPKLKRTQHQITITGAENIELDSYPGAFSQILTNLVVNSLLHGFEHKVKGHITIDLNVRNQELLLRYSDDGKGMNSEQIKRIFEPFYTTKRGQGGSGLGMHVVYNLVTQTLRGRIELTSTLEKGVTFTLRVPINKEIENE